MNKIFSFDIETDGLYGEGFAVGAVVYENGKEVARFDGIAEQYAVTNEWVKENVLPHLLNLTQFESKKALREAFWAFWMAHKQDATCIGDFGSPVESYWFRQCIEDDLDARQWNGPYPLHEVGTMLLAKDINPDTNRIEYSGYNGVAHNPVDDAIASALTWIKVTKEQQ